MSYIFSSYKFILYIYVSQSTMSLPNYILQKKLQTNGNKSTVMLKQNEVPHSSQRIIIFKL